MGLSDQAGETWVGADLGKSEVRLRIRRGAAGQPTDIVGPGYNFAEHTDAVRGILEVLEATFKTLERPPHRCVLGMTGMPARDVDQQRLLAGLGVFCEGGWVALTEDYVTAHAGALDGPGTLLIAGTGAVAFAMGADGTWDRADGWGPHLGDEGGAFWLGREGLRAAFADHDGRGPSTAMTALAAEFLGGVDYPAAHRLHVRLDAVSHIAGFARLVGRAAAAGDPAASELLTRAISALSRTAIAAARWSGSARVSWSGGLFQLGEPLVEPLRAQLAEAGLELREPLRSALDGALELCGTSASFYSHKLVTLPGDAATS